MTYQISTYRVMTPDRKEVITQGHWAGLDDVKNYLISRNEKMTEKDVGVFRLERENKGKWDFVEEFTIEN